MRQSNSKYQSCYPQICFFNCGDPQLRNASNEQDDYQLSQLTSNSRRTQKTHKKNYQLELGPSSKQQREPMIKKNKQQLKISMKERNSQDISKSKKLSLRKIESFHSKTNSFRKSEQTTQKFYFNINHSEDQSDYLNYPHINNTGSSNFPLNVLYSFQNSPIQSRSKKQIFADKVNTINNMQNTKFYSKKQQKLIRLDIGLKQNEYIKTSYPKGNTVRLGQNLPTLRSEYQNTNGPRTERSEVIYHQSKFLH